MARTEKFTCGRRGDPFAFGAGEVLLDEWRPDGTCSYCGSVSPDAFLAAIEAGHQVGPTDKNYKAYIDIPEPRAGELTASSLANSKTKPDGEAWVKVTWRLRRKYIIGPNWRWVILRPLGPTRHAKFYFQHLDEAGRTRFIQMLNAGKMNVGYPGYFYRRPYFARPIGGTDMVNQST